MTTHHRWKDIRQSAGQLEHDHNNGNGDPGDSAVISGANAKTHPSAAAAPRKAYVPGVIHGASG